MLLCRLASNQQMAEQIVEDKAALLKLLDEVKVRTGMLDGGQAPEPSSAMHRARRRELGVMAVRCFQMMPSCPPPLNS